MVQKLKFDVFGLCLLGLSFCNPAFSQSSNPPFALTAGVTIAVTDTTSFQFSNDTNSYPINDLVENRFGNSKSVTLLYPDESTLVSEMDGLKINGGTSDSSVTAVISLPFETYIKGVVRAETLPLWDQIEEIKAQAVAARSYAGGLAIPYKETTVGGISCIIAHPGVTQNYIPYVPSLPGWDGGPNGEDGIAGEATTLTSEQKILCFDRNNSQTQNGLTTGIEQLIFAAFGNGFRGNSNDEIFYNVASAHWLSPPYLKSRDTNDSGQGTVTVGGLGFSQIGANGLATSGWTYQSILNYFYAVNPPTIRALDIYQGDSSDISNARYSMSWNDVASSGTSISLDGVTVCSNPDSRMPETILNNSLNAGTTAVICS